MKVEIQLSHEEVMEAVRSWMAEKGIPVVAIDDTQLEQKVSLNSNWTRTDKIRMTCRYECDALGAAETANARPFTQPSQYVTGEVSAPPKRTKSPHEDAGWTPK